MMLIISLPSKALYDVAKESFEGGGPKVVEYIISSLDDTKLKNSLRVALLNAYDDQSTGDEEFWEVERPDLGEPEALVEPVVGNPQPGLELDKEGEVLTENEQNGNG